jgi:predicted HTH transcriptional regulator
MCICNKKAVSVSYMPAPVFMKEGMFTLVLQRSQKVTEKMSEKILRLIGGNNSITTHQLAEILGKSTRTIERYLNNFKKQGILQRIGPDKGGHWKIIKKETLS